MNSSDPIACNLSALTESERERRAELARSLRAAARRVDELPDGYGVVLDSTSPIIGELETLLALEARCCPFLQFEQCARSGEVVLRVTGREGVKDFLRAEFGLSATERF